jgi:hypothetical protein
MAGYIKQVLLSNRYDDLFRVDLVVCIQDAYKYKILSNQDVRFLDLYLSGYTNQEISISENILQDDVDKVLARVFLVLETLIGYTDEEFVNKLRVNKYRKSGILKMEELLALESKDFSKHEI